MLRSTAVRSGCSSIYGLHGSCLVTQYPTLSSAGDSSHSRIGKRMCSNHCVWHLLFPMHPEVKSNKGCTLDVVAVLPRERAYWTDALSSSLSLKSSTHGMSPHAFTWVWPIQPQRRRIRQPSKSKTAASKQTGPGGLLDKEELC